MDTFILSSSLMAFALFLTIHIVLVRHLAYRHVIQSFFLLSGVCGLSILMVNGLSFVLYTLLVGIYFMGIFGVTETSIRIRLLTDIARAKEAGITRTTLLRDYNHTVIVKKRLDRFIASGDIEKKGDLYFSKKKLTFFMVPAWILDLMWKLYGKSSIVYAKQFDS